MTAQTHQEVYRPFRGSLRPHPLRFLPVVAAHLRVESKRKLPLLLVYAVPTIATVIFAWLVYARYAAEASQLPDAAGGGDFVTNLIAERAMKQLEVRNQIARFNAAMQFFALVPAAWFGSGLFAEDRRVGAHLLYFSRPLTRLDYFLGKLLTAMFFTACAVWLPGLVICLVAAFASQDWSFLKEEGDVVLWMTLHSFVWTSVTSLVVLAVSSLAPRKIFALLGFFGCFMALHVFGMLMGEVLERRAFRAISPLLDLLRVGQWAFDLEERFPGMELSLAWGVLAGLSALSLAVIVWRLRRLEVVA